MAQKRPTSGENRAVTVGRLVQQRQLLLIPEGPLQPLAAQLSLLLLTLLRVGPADVHEEPMAGLQVPRFQGANPQSLRLQRR
jgi:hypothetical protein